MSQNTAIAWTDYSWSPWWGCTPVSPGCANCYASVIAKRFRGYEYRKGGPRQLAKDWDSPRKWSLLNPLLPKRVFPSMCDPFDHEVPEEWRVNFFDLIDGTPSLTWLLLTKRPEEAAKFLEERGGLLDNVWLGVSVEDQQRAEERIQALIQIPAKMRFVSVEPLLEPVDLGLFGTTPKNFVSGYLSIGSLIDWVIVGAESGPSRRDCGIGPLISVVEQCVAAGVPVFCKQDCALKPGQQGRIPDHIWARKEFPTT